MSTRNEERERLRQHRLDAQQKGDAKTKRERAVQLGIAAILGVFVIGALVLVVVGGGGSSTSTAQAGAFGQHFNGLEERRLAAGVPTMSDPGSGEHFHPTLAVYANGKKITIPVNIGIDPNLPPSEMAGLHTHDELGTIHVENADDPTLGQFFEIWGVPFGRERLGPYRTGEGSAVRMWVDGKPSQAYGALKLADGQQIVVSFDDLLDAPPPPLEFPPARGRTLQEIAERLPEAKLVVSPAGRVFDVGSNRFAFGVFTLGGEQVSDADIALYFARGLKGQARGPFPARIDSLKTPAAFRSKTTADDPTAATTVYVVPRIELKSEGELTMLALIRRDGELQATRLPSVVVGQFDSVPDVGDPAPRIQSPTEDDVADIAEIETRIPPDTMHDIDFADVLGKEPILIVFATPQLCQSRVCGPTVDIVEQVKAEFGDRAAFIHMEIYNQNDPNKGLRPQVRAFNLPSEPWAFLVDRQGRISARFEGAFAADELSRALVKIAE